MTQGQTLSIGAVVMVVAWGILLLMSGCTSATEDPHYLIATHTDNGHEFADVQNHPSYGHCIKAMEAYEQEMATRYGQQRVIVLSSSDTNHIQTVYRASNVPTQIFIRCLSGRNG